MSYLHDWATRNHITLEAFRDLQTTLGLYTPELPPTAPAHGKSEAFVQSDVRLEASEKRILCWRNNVGALTPKGSTRPVRYGLANDSEQMNKVLKSSDLVAVRPTLIEPRHVGTVLGHAVFRECKPPGWQFNPQDEHEAAQWAFGRVVIAAGADFAFATGRGTL